MQLFLVHATCCTATPGTSQVDVALVHARRYIPGTSNALLLCGQGWFPFQPAGHCADLHAAAPGTGSVAHQRRLLPLGHVAVCRQYIVSGSCTNRASLKLCLLGGRGACSA